MGAKLGERYSETKKKKKPCKRILERIFLATWSGHGQRLTMWSAVVSAPVVCPAGAELSPPPKVMASAPHTAEGAVAVAEESEEAALSEVC